MPMVVGVSLRSAGKIHYYNAGSQRYYTGERVLVETARGLELGTVRLTPHEVGEEEGAPPLKYIIRRATASDITRDAANRDREEHALQVCKGLVEKLNLPMRLINVEYNFDGSHVLIHFLSESRVDFRELVRELARQLRSRIELRQVGVRDEAKLIGGYGICGRSLCCAAFLSNFAPVAINVAKVQGLALNPQKISGSCGRLMCCLAFEYEHYRDSHADMPRVNSRVETPRGPGKITKLNVLSRQVEVTIADAPSPIWFSVDELNGNMPAPACAADGGCGGCCAQHGEGECHAEGLPTVAPAKPARSRATAAKVRASAPPQRAKVAPTPEETPEEAKRKRRPRRRKKTDTAAAGAQPAAPPRANTPASSDAPAAPRPRRRRRKPAPAGANAASTPPITGQYQPNNRQE